MALVLRQAGNLKPEARLQQAVQSFEADLSSEQKIEFRQYRATPRPDDVMRITADINHSAAKSGIRKPFGPRFASFLDSVQQFAALGDIIIGGSQNLIACGVWSLVRLSLLTMVKFSTHLEKLSSIIMAIGRSSPQVQAMASVYSRSKELQGQVAEYFIVVVEFCHSILQFTKKSAIRQLASVFRDSEAKEYQEKLEKWAMIIRDQMTILMSQRLEDEANENSKLRAWAASFSASQLAQRNLRNKERVLESCSLFNFKADWKRIRSIGNTARFASFPEYMDWRDNQEDMSSTLIFSGILGSGKSVMLANIVEDLTQKLSQDNTFTAYFFCRHDVEESLQSETIMGSLARQILDGMGESVFQSQKNEDLNTVDLLANFLDHESNTYIVLDGLYECPPEEQNNLLQQLCRLQSATSLHLLLSMRLEPNTHSKFKHKELADSQVIHLQKQNDDIDEFVDSELQKGIASGQLVVADPSLILEIRDALLRDHEGMFLWVALQVKSLFLMRSDEAIRLALESLPKDLPSTYARILKAAREADTSPGDMSYQKRILELVLVAKRPLTADELREALNVIPGDTVWKPSGLVNNIFSTLSSCGSLLVVDDEDFTIRFVHETVKTFLLGGPIQSQKNHPSHPESESQSENKRVIHLKDAEASMGDIIITYLNYGAFENRLVTTKTQPKEIIPSPQDILSSVLPQSSVSQNLALMLLQAKRDPSIDINKILADAKSRRERSAEFKQDFLFYARSFCWEHVPYHSGKISIYALLRRYIFRLPGMGYDSSNATLLTCVARSDNEQLMKWVLNNIKKPTLSDLYNAFEVCLQLDRRLLGRTLISSHQWTNEIGIPIEIFPKKDQLLRRSKYGFEVTTSDQSPLFRWLKEAVPLGVTGIVELLLPSTSLMKDQAVELWTLASNLTNSLDMMRVLLQSERTTEGFDTLVWNAVKEYDVIMVNKLINCSLGTSVPKVAMIAFQRAYDEHNPKPKPPKPSTNGRNKLRKAPYGKSETLQSVSDALEQLRAAQDQLESDTSGDVFLPGVGRYIDSTEDD